MHQRQEESTVASQCGVLPRHWAVQSAKVRAVGRGGKEIRCGICHQTGLSWDELRHCVQQAAPVHLCGESLEHDVLSRRFVWDPQWIPFYASKVKKQMK